MEEKVENKEGISIKEIFKILLKKIKLLLLVLLIGATVGVGFGFLTNVGKIYYGTSMQFYVNPVPTEDEVESDSYFAVNGTYTRNVMDGLIKLLSSESFVERLLMDEDGLPIERFRDSENAENINAKIAEALGPIDREKAANEALELVKEARADAQEDYSKKHNKWVSIQDEIIFAKNTGNLDVLPTLNALLEEAKQVRAEARAILDEKNDEHEIALDNQKIAKKEAEKARNAVYAEYRKTNIYKKLLQKIHASVQFSWYKSSEEEHLEMIARSFIYVDIQVEDDEKLAHDLYDQICAVLPNYVSEAMPKPSGYAGTACRQITRLDQVGTLNASQAPRASLKYGLLLGLASFTVACVAVILTERKHKNKAQ